MSLTLHFMKMRTVFPGKAMVWNTSLGFTKSEVYDKIAIGTLEFARAIGWDEIHIATTFADAVSGGQQH